jgi:hypothetical protein
VGQRPLLHAIREKASRPNELETAPADTTHCGYSTNGHNLASISGRLPADKSAYKFNALANVRALI